MGSVQAGRLSLVLRCVLVVTGVIVAFTACMTWIGPSLKVLQSKTIYLVGNSLGKSQNDGTRQQVYQPQIPPPVCDAAQKPDFLRLKSFSLNIPPVVNGDSFTVMILTYNRLPALMTCLKMYTSMSMVAKVIVLWNNEQVQPPNLTANLTSKVPVVVERRRNKLSTRFETKEVIDTEAVLAADDDLAYTEQDLYHAFQVWKDHPYGLVGFKSSMRGFSFKNNKYEYLTSTKSDYSIVLTQTVFMHREHMKLFKTRVPSSVKEHIDNNMNCEDIALNMFVSDACGCAAAFSVSNKKTRFTAKSGDGLHGRPLHYAKRSKCLNLFAEHFDNFPLKKVSSSCVY